LEDNERSLELLLRTNSFRASRSYLNLGSALVDAGDVVRGEAVTREGLAFARKLGIAETAIRWFVGNLADIAFLHGGWDEALALAEQQIAG
jgi:hypothetical protein